MMSTNLSGSSIDYETKKWAVLDLAFHTPPFCVPTIAENEKLQGHKNYEVWRRMVKLDLGSFNLLHFINAENGGTNINISVAKRRVLNAQALQYLKRSVSETYCALTTKCYKRIWSHEYNWQNVYKKSNAHTCCSVQQIHKPEVPTRVWLNKICSRFWKLCRWISFPWDNV